MSSAVQQFPAPFTPTDSQMAVAYSVCRSIARTSAKNFYYAFLALPKPKREALCAVYAFMRKCDDIADNEAMPIRERRQKLYAWLDDFHRAHAGQATDDPVLMALTDAQRRFLIPVGWLDQLAYGTAMDVEEDPEKEYERLTRRESSEANGLTIRYQTFEDLAFYCYRVASVVGLVCIKIFGYRDPAAEQLAERCGLAFQLTNIIRDVKEDAEQGRIYLPQEDLIRFGITPEELQSASDAARFAPLLALEADRAREYYRAGEELIAYVEEDSQPALWALVTIYQRLLEKIAAQQYDVFHGKVRLTTREKLMILGKGVVKRLL
ncbi:MAG TPA: phytoene/squalene synthase family protein [Terriglobales bacterium]|jgi:phytoene synthase